MKVQHLQYKRIQNHHHSSKDHAYIIHSYIEETRKELGGGTSITSSTLDVARWEKKAWTSPFEVSDDTTSLKTFFSCDELSSIST